MPGPNSTRADSSFTPEDVDFLARDFSPAIFDHMLNGVACCRMLFENGKPYDFVYLYTNPAFHKQTGLGPVGGKRLTDVSPRISESARLLFEIYERVAASGASEIFETFVESLNQWLAIQIFSPRPGYFVAILDVITERKQAVAALRESERRYHDLFDWANEGLLIMTEDGKLFDVNQAFAKMHGYSVDELKQMDIADLDVLKEKTLEAHADIGRRMRAGEVVRFEVEHYHKDGHVFPLSVTGSRISLGGRKYFLTFHQDITERKKAEAALQESEERYRELFNNISSGVAIYEVKDNGNDFIFKDFNKAGERLDGDRKEDVIGKSIYEARPGIKEFGLLNVFKRVWETGVPEHCAASFYEDDRIKKWFENHVYKLPNGDIVAVYDDVTERKRSAEMLEAVMTQLTMVEERERRAIATDLHDGISQLLAVAKIKLRSLPTSDSAGDAHQSFQEAVEVVEQAERSARSLSLQISPPLLFDLGLVPALQSLAEELHKVYRLTATINDDGKPKDLAPTTRSVLYRATRELLINVAKHAKVNVAHVDVQADNGQVVISVTDSGVGFDKSLVGKHAPGSGFGLISMRERLRLIGGQFDIDTHPGDGTVATLVVPAAGN